MEIIDIDDTPFIATDWIGIGKHYADAPFPVIGAKNAVFALPAAATALFPAGNLPVIKFTELTLPRMSSELIYGESQLWFHDDEPTCDLSLLEGRSIPPTAVLNLLSRKSGQAWLNGAKSIADPRFNDGGDRFPLWVLTFWKEMEKILEMKKSWKRSIQWADNHAKKSQDIETKNAIEEARQAYMGF